MDTRHLYCIVGPSGSGKTTLMNGLRGYGFTEAISYTTRKCRGKDDEASYHFTDRDTFLRMVEEGAFAEHVNYIGNLYGVSLEELDHNNFVIVEPAGVEAIKENYKNRPVVVIGLNASREALEERLCGRTDNSGSRIDEDQVKFKDLVVIADVCIEGLTPEDTLAKTLEFLRSLGEEF